MNKISSANKFILFCITALILAGLLVRHNDKKEEYRVDSATSVYVGSAMIAPAITSDMEKTRCVGFWLTVDSEEIAKKARGISALKDLGEAYCGTLGCPKCESLVVEVKVKK